MTRTAATRQSHPSCTSTPTGALFPRSLASCSSSSTTASDTREPPTTLSSVWMLSELQWLVC